MKISLTRHAHQQMQLRGIRKDQVITVITRGSRIRQTDGWLSIYGYIAVAYKIYENDEYKIKTVMII